MSNKTKGKITRSKKITVGAYYFDGWAGRNRFADDTEQPWAKDAPTHLTWRMVDEFPGLKGRSEHMNRIHRRNEETGT